MEDFIKIFVSLFRNCCYLEINSNLQKSCTNKNSTENIHILFTQITYL